MAPLKAIVGCEFSGVVRRALRALGVDAYSCDLLPAEDASPYHLDVSEIAKRFGGGGHQHAAGFEEDL